MFEAAQEIVKRAFEGYGFKRLQAWCIKENVASSSLMKILGMRFKICIHSQRYRHKGFWDRE